MGTTTDKQIEDLRNLVTKYDSVIKGMDDIIDFEQNQREELIEQRAQLNANIDNLMKPAGTSKPIAAATVVPPPSILPVVGPIITVGMGLIAVIDHANKRADEEIVRIEENLKKQKEWKKQHPGKTK